LAKENNSPLIVLTETWLEEGVLDAEIKIPGYYVVRTDRMNRVHGGVAIYVKEGLGATTILTHSNGKVEILALKIKELETIVFWVLPSSKQPCK
jgi:hypothetical protein